VNKKAGAKLHLGQQSIMFGKAAQIRPIVSKPGPVSVWMTAEVREVSGDDEVERVSNDVKASQLDRAREMLKGTRHKGHLFSRPL
jgi:hypothetical protein